MSPHYPKCLFTRTGGKLDEAPPSPSVCEELTFKGLEKLNLSPFQLSVTSGQVQVSARNSWIFLSLLLLGPKPSSDFFAFCYFLALGQVEWPWGSHSTTSPNHTTGMNGSCTRQALKCLECLWHLITAGTSAIFPYWIHIKIFYIYVFSLELIHFNSLIISVACIEFPQV